MIIKKIFIFVKLTHLFSLMKRQKIGICEIKRWKKAFFCMLCDMKKESSDYLERWKVVEGFTKCDIKYLKKGRRPRSKENPILISVVLNEIERMDVFLNHYRKIGIKRFAILDNGSTDGTVEFLRKQSDVDLFQVSDNFESKIKIGWINRLVSHYGTNYWYLVVDADELLVWEDVEEDCIQNIIRYFNQKRITHVRALMIDMYSKNTKWNTDESFENVFPECKYFDYNTYYHKKTNEAHLVCGGPRKRVLDREVWLTKYPLFKIRKNEIVINPHVIYPYDDMESACYLALLHYKFLTKNDQRKMRRYARRGNYACNSAEYKSYLQKQRENKNNFQFYFEESAEYISSQSLRQVEEIKAIWKD